MIIARSYSAAREQTGDRPAAQANGGSLCRSAAGRQGPHERTFIILGSTCRSPLWGEDVRSGNACALDCALAGYAAPLLGDGVCLYHLQSIDRGNTVEGALSDAGNADRR